jgi:pimeloyl-ACP methyl ester carboxylesterase
MDGSQRAFTFQSGGIHFEDSIVWETASKLKNAIEGHDNSVLYLEALSSVLGLELARAQHEVAPAPTINRGGLASWQKRAVVGYIEEHLGEQMSLSKLAAFARLSQHHFCRAFKQSFGVPPHHYQVLRRMDAAKVLDFGQSDMPSPQEFKYTFDALAKCIERFTEVISLARFAIYVFDYGAPTGFRLAMHHPERITAIISQNGNAYEEGLSDGWNPIRAYWKDPSVANREALRAFLQPDTTVWQYTHGVPDLHAVSPDGYSLDNHYLARKGADEVQLDLFGDYKTNVALYPKFQEYFRTHKPPFLAVWGKNDPFFLPPGANAFKRDIPKVEVEFFDAGHFALEVRKLARPYQASCRGM